MQLPDYLSKGEPARLIPVVADSNREQRAASILLAAMRSVHEFRQSMLSSLGIHVRQRSRLHVWTEICFKDSKNGKSRSERPDGLIILDTGRSQWRALVEAKIGNAELNAEQISTYLSQAKEYDINAVLTISNQFVAQPSHHPVKVQKILTRGVDLYHWSWMYAVTQATLLLEDGTIQSEDQRFILEEVLRYFSHVSSGVTQFDRMNREWKEVIGKVQTGAILKPADEEVENTVSSWHQEQRDLCLVMSRRLARGVGLKLSRAHRTDPGQRLKDDCALLSNERILRCALEIPDVTSPVEVCASLTRRTITCSLWIAAPQDKKRTSARVNWLIRQLTKTNPESIFVKAVRPGRATDTQASLAEVLENPEVLESAASPVPPVGFEVFYLVDLATRFSGNRIFIEELEKAVPYFYEQVAQRVRPWIASPPVIRREDPAQSDAGHSPAVSESGEDKVGTDPGNIDFPERLVIEKTNGNISSGTGLRTENTETSVGEPEAGA